MRNRQKSTNSQQPKLSQTCNLSALDSKQKTSNHNSPDIAPPKQFLKTSPLPQETCTLNIKARDLTFEKVKGISLTCTARKM